MGDVFHDDHAVQAVDLSRQVGVWTWDIRADILTETPGWHLYFR